MRICEQKMIRTVEEDMFYLRSLQSMTIAKVENEKGLCAYILYMHIAPCHFQSSICLSFM